MKRKNQISFRTGFPDGPFNPPHHTSYSDSPNEVILLRVSDVVSIYRAGLKVDSDEDAEQELYDSYKCWCKTVVTTKLASIDSNKQKIAELEQYIADLDSGRIELTSER